VATLTLDRDRLRVSFPTKEKLLGLVRDLDVPLTSVVGARQVRSWGEDLRGWRVGLGLPGVWLLGRWISRGHRQLVALRRDRPAVYVRLRDQKYDELLIETPEPEAVLAHLPRIS
jgi:hypothetical protein